MSSVPASRRCCAGLLGLCLAMAAPAAAQHERAHDGSSLDQPARDKESARSLALLRERNREALHPGEPLTIVGLEQEDNEFRSATPALVHCDSAVPLVDPEDAYGRALAMYAKGAVFHQPPARSTSAAAADSSRKQARARAAKPIEAGLDVPEKVSSALLLAVALLCLLGARRHLRVFLRRRRAAA